MNLIYQFVKAFKLAKKRNWDTIYVAVDIHETILVPCYYEKETYKFYPFSKKALRMMSQDKSICLILWTSASKEMMVKYLHYFDNEGIHFDYVNENPECPSTDLANFDQKFYMNVGIDDKFGFIANIGWFELYLYFLWRKIVH